MPTTSLPLASVTLTAGSHCAMIRASRCALNALTVAAPLTPTTEVNQSVGRQKCGFSHHPNAIDTSSDTATPLRAAKSTRASCWSLERQLCQPHLCDTESIWSSKRIGKLLCSPVLFQKRWTSLWVPYCLFLPSYARTNHCFCVLRDCQPAKHRHFYCCVTWMSIQKLDVGVKITVSMDSHFRMAFNKKRSGQTFYKCVKEVYLHKKTGNIFSWRMGGFCVHSHIYNISEIVTSSLPNWAAAHPHHPRYLPLFKHYDDSRVLHFKKSKQTTNVLPSWTYNISFQTHLLIYMHVHIDVWIYTL